MTEQPAWMGILPCYNPRYSGIQFSDGIRCIEHAVAHYDHYPVTRVSNVKCDEFLHELENGEIVEKSGYVVTLLYDGQQHICIDCGEDTGDRGTPPGRFYTGGDENLIEIEQEPDDDSDDEEDEEEEEEEE